MSDARSRGIQPDLPLRKGLDLTGKKIAECMARIQSAAQQSVPAHSMVLRDLLTNGTAVKSLIDERDAREADRDRAQAESGDRLRALILIAIDTTAAFFTIIGVAGNGKQVDQQHPVVEMVGKFLAQAGAEVPEIGWVGKYWGDDQLVQRLHQQLCKDCDACTGGVDCADDGMPAKRPYSKPTVTTCDGCGDTKDNDGDDSKHAVILDNCDSPVCAAERADLTRALDQNVGLRRSRAQWKDKAIALEDDIERLHQRLCKDCDDGVGCTDDPCTGDRAAKMEAALRAIVDAVGCEHDNNGPFGEQSCCNAYPDDRDGWCPGCMAFDALHAVAGE